MVTVLLAEDHKMVRQGTQLYLESMGVAVVGEATNGREAVAIGLQHGFITLEGTSET